MKINEGVEPERDLLADALFSSGSLAEALQKSRGMFPTEVLGYFKLISQSRTKKLLAEARNEGLRDGSMDSFLCSTWRFHKTVLSSIKEKVICDEDRVALLGVPSLVKVLEAAAPDQPHVFIDLQPEDIQRGDVMAFTQDINLMTGREFSEAFDLVVFDPPWYTEIYKKWAEVSAKLLRFGGRMCFPLFQEYTRPKAIEERKEICEFCEKMGFNVELMDDCVLYDPPSFERSMLNRAGIPAVPWKRADLVIASKETADLNTRGFESFIPSALFGHVVLQDIMFDVKFDKYVVSTGPLVGWPSTGFWMTTPSRRDEGTIDCNVYTSNGLRFITPRPLDLYASLQTAACRPDQNKLLQDLGFPSELLFES